MSNVLLLGTPEKQHNNRARENIYNEKHMQSLNVMMLLENFLDIGRPDSIAISCS